MIETILLHASLFLNAFEDPFMFGVLLACSALVLSLLKKSASLSFFVAMGTTFMTVHIIKSLYAIPRPIDALVDAAGYRFPSGHAALGAALITSFAWHLLKRSTSSAGRTLIVIISSALILFVAWTRLHLGVHEVIDVSVGILLGTSISILVHFLVDKVDTGK